MAKPLELPSFATDATLTGGPQIGQVPRLRPSNTLLAQGFYQGRRLPSRMISWLLGTIGDWLELTAHARTSTWAHCAIAATPIGNQQFLNAVGQTGGIGTAANQQRLIAALGTKTSNSDATLSLSADGLDFTGSVGDLGYAHFSAVAGDKTGTIFGGLTAVATCKSYALATGTSSTFTPGNSAVVEAAHFSVSHYLIGAGAHVYSSTALGSGWSNVAIGSVGDTIGTFVDNGSAPPSGNLRVILRKIAVVNGHAFVYYSSDDGQTWTAGKDFGAVNLSLGYSKVLDLFIAIDVTNKQLWTSVDGNAWALISTFATLDTGGLSGHHALAACGVVIAHLLKHTGVANQQLNGIAYTLDLGVTWREVYFGNVNTGQPMRALISTNGRLYALDDFNVYTSGLLETPGNIY